MDNPDRENGSGSHSDGEGGNPQFYNQAIALCTRALDAGALREALMWAQQAELIGAALNNKQGDMPEVSTLYAKIMLDACLRTQESVLTCGNFLPKHNELADLISVTSNKLADRLERVSGEPRMLALLAQGYAKQHGMRLGQTSQRETGMGLALKVQELDKMLENLSNIERCATLLSGPNPPTLPFDRKLVIAKIAVSNARFSLTRLFSKQLSNWFRAEFFCRQAYKLLTERSITETAATSGNSELDEALKDLPTAYRSLQNRSYRDSARHLEQAGAHLERANPKT